MLNGDRLQWKCSKNLELQARKISAATKARREALQRPCLSVSPLLKFTREGELRPSRFRESALRFGFRQATT